MKQILFVLLCGLLVASCKEPATNAKSSPKTWYSDYFANSLSAGQTFHSEVILTAGQKTELKIPSNEPIIVGFTLEKGYEVYQSKSSVYLGTPEEPHKVGGAPGVSHEFEPKDGVITLIVENTSPVDTRIAFYTEPAKKK
ncbi:hypothetical protein OKA05_09655 [Luteolibacter arcticus]|uniref:Lipoprotein n=1 Tax=Luteolibacter arcticus TaxID=1581411 RepID=A0ABT3GGS1_9BACT|nr:hypothetical protein [Luteolibacter arcticus]MCW1922814.1 hypothetical protein [Luteolibacter arcticus]